MSNYVDYTSFVALIDDDARSANLLTRTLVAHSAPGVQYYGDGVAALPRLQAVISDSAANRPAMIVLDLKAHSAANLDYLVTIAPLLAKIDIPFVVLTAQADTQSRALLDHGAAAVFVRHADRDAYRRVAADIIEFGTPSERPVAVGM